MGRETIAPAEAAIAVEGMDCASCVAHVERAITAVPGALDARVNLARGRAVVRYDPGLTNPAAVAQAIDKSGYRAHPEESHDAANAEEARLARQQAHARAWFRRAIVGLVLWLPLEAFHWLNYLAGSHHYSMMWMTWAALVTSTVAIFYVGFGFYRGAWAALRNRTTNMDTLIAMGATVAYGYSLVTLILFQLDRLTTLPALYFMESTGLLALISFGHWLEARARDKAGSAIRELLNLAPGRAIRLDGD